MRIRPMLDADVEAVVRVWHASGRAAYPYIDPWQRFTLDEAREVFRGDIAAVCDVWVAETTDGVIGYLALKESYLSRLYVSPVHQGCGIGSALLAHAMACSPTGLELHTHQKNVGARRFYEKRGFVAVRFGISPAPENEPDVEYHWRPRSPA